MTPDRMHAPLVLLAIALQLTLSANLFTWIGIPYAAPGGNPVEKFHPATWILCLALARARYRNPRLLREAPRALLAAILLMLAVMAYSVASVGPSGAAVYVESFLAPAILAWLLHLVPDRDRRRAGRTALALMLANIAIALGETAASAHLVPIYLEDRILVDPPGEFRAAALFDHPLTAAMATMTALLSLPALRLSRPAAFASAGILAIGLLAFGGRAALLVSIAAGGGAGGVWLFRRLLARRLGLRAACALLLGAALLPLCVAALFATTSLGGRIAAHFCVDASAQSRSTEWLLLGELDLRSLLFGTPISVTPGLIYKLGLQYAFTDIENFWLMAFVDLGIVGFLAYSLSLLLLLRHLWRQAGHPMLRVAIASLVVVASTSNSLGRKCDVLTILTVFACAAAGTDIGPGRAPARRPAATGGLPQPARPTRHGLACPAGA